jgi:hypothetical protein
MTGYDDGRIVCDDHGLVIRHYYLVGAKRISYSAIHGVVESPLGAGKWRIHGSGDFVHWFNFDPRRPRKDTALVITLDAKTVRPVITPDDPARVAAELTAHGVPVTLGREAGVC